MLLDIKNLHIAFSTESDRVVAVKNLCLQLEPGQTLGLVGESGSGKSVTALSILQLLPKTATVDGQIWYTPSAEQAPVNLLAIPESSMTTYRGAEIAMIYQEPMTALNPVYRCGSQVVEAIRVHRKISLAEARDQTLALFEKVKLPDPPRIFRAFPHELSGGQKQRVLISMALAAQPKILIADEPTTALDVTVQKAILDLLRELREENGLSMIFISHDLGVISDIADTVSVMQSGEIVESGPKDQILRQPSHAYTRGLLACRPSLTRKWQRLPTIADFQKNEFHEARVVTTVEKEQRQRTLFAKSPMLRVGQLAVRYPARKNILGTTIQWHWAVNDVSFDVYPGEVFGIAGESGCGKTSLGRAVCQLLKAESGSVQFNGIDLNTLPEPEKSPFRRQIQMVFQDPYSSLNPRMTVGEALMEAMEAHQLFPNRNARRDKSVDILETVGLEAGHLRRYPHEFSGGQRQRICLARALAVQPQLLICDEVVSALDVSVQATVLNLLLDLQEKFGLSYLFISHDLSVIRQMCDRMMVMENGKMVELGFPDVLLTKPEKPYLKKLVESVPGQHTGHVS